MRPIAALTGLAALAAATPDHFQSVSSVLCTDLPAKTVTVTAAAAGCSSVSSSAVTPPPVFFGSGSGASTVISVGMTINEIGSAQPIYSIIGSNTASYTSASASSLTTSGSASAKTHSVEVGAFPDDSSPLGKVFQFRPNNITAAIGDVVEFNMLGASHSVTQSQFQQPCIQNGTFDTGLQANPNNITNLIVEHFIVDVATPLWFYCKQTMPVSHCGTGMVFSINPKSDEQMVQFIDMAIAQNGTGSATNATTSALAAGATSVALAAKNATAKVTGAHFRH